VYFRTPRDLEKSRDTRSLPCRRDYCCDSSNPLSPKEQGAPRRGNRPDIATPSTGIPATQAPSLAPFSFDEQSFRDRQSASRPERGVRASVSRREGSKAGIDLPWPRSPITTQPVNLDEAWVGLGVATPAQERLLSLVSFQACPAVCHHGALCPWRARYGLNSPGTCEPADASRSLLEGEIPSPP